MVSIEFFSKGASYIARLRVVPSKDSSWKLSYGALFTWRNRHTLKIRLIEPT